MCAPVISLSPVIGPASYLDYAVALLDGAWCLVASHVINCNLSLSLGEREEFEGTEGFLFGGHP